MCGLCVKEDRTSAPGASPHLVTLSPTSITLPIIQHELSFSTSRTFIPSHSIYLYDPRNFHRYNVITEARCLCAIACGDDISSRVLRPPYPIAICKLVYCLRSTSDDMVVQLQWGLEKTSTSTLEIATGLLRAATTDNVQPLAILACEQFGNTLAISPEAIRKVEHIVLPTPKPAVVTFLQSTIGYSANDCASQLGKNTAGLQFLALATALITTLGCFKSSLAIHEMLASTAKDKTLLPTARQVRELLESIEPRCSRASMMDDVLGWDKLFRDNSVSESEKRTWENWEGSHPDGTGIAGLVDALRQLRRIGNEDTDRITIRTGICASWTIAFVKWCIGYPPSVVLPDGTRLLEQAGSEVILELINQSWFDQSFCVTVHSYIHGPSELVAADCGGIIFGMVPMRRFGNFLLHREGFHTGPAADAFQEAIPYALQQVIQRLRCSADEEGGTLSGSDPRIHLGVSPFPEAGIISQSYHCLFGEDIDLRTSDDRLHKACMRTMPLMASYLSELGKICRCEVCSPSDLKAPLRRCKRNTATESFGILVASILALSLFDRPDSLQVHIRSDWLTQVSDGFRQTVMGILEQDETSFTCTVDSILCLALDMVGHESSSYHSRWVMSSDKGQTVWPAMYETSACPQRGFLHLTWLPGILAHKGDVFRRAISVAARYKRVPFPLEGTHRVARPLNLCQTLTTRWNVQALPAELNVTMLVETTQGMEITSICIRPALHCMAASLFLERCGHPSDSLMESPDPKAKFTGPSPFVDPGKISVVAVDGDDRLRFAALCTGKAEPPGKILLRGDACLACCLETCRRTGARILIL